MARIEVLGGDFMPNPKSRFEGMAMLLCARGEGTLTAYQTGEIVRFGIRDGAWARMFIDAGDWTRALGSAAVAGVPAVGVNWLPTLFLGQKEIVTWANALIGAAAATAALKSARMVRFEVRFASSKLLLARAPERGLMMRLPHIYRAIARRT